MTAYVYFYLAEKFGGVPLIKELQEYDPANHAYRRFAKKHRIVKSLVPDCPNR